MVTLSPSKIIELLLGGRKNDVLRVLLPAATHEGLSALDYAEQRGFIEVANYLRTAMAKLELASPIVVSSMLCYRDGALLDFLWVSFLLRRNLCLSLFLSRSLARFVVAKASASPPVSDNTGDSGVDDFLGLVCIYIYERFDKDSLTRRIVPFLFSSFACASFLSFCALLTFVFSLYAGRR